DAQSDAGERVAPAQDDPATAARHLAGAVLLEHQARGAFAEAVERVQLLLGHRTPRRGWREFGVECGDSFAAFVSLLWGQRNERSKTSPNKSGEGIAALHTRRLSEN